MKVYGEKVVGKKAAARAMKSQKKANQYGPKVLGKSVDDSPEAEAKREALKGGGAGDDELKALMEKHANEEGYLSIEKVKTVLADLPASFDKVVGWEFGRADGPRVGALVHFIEVESKREGGARPSMLKNLEVKLAALRSKGS